MNLYTQVINGGVAEWVKASLFNMAFHRYSANKARNNSDYQFYSGCYVGLCQLLMTEMEWDITDINKCVDIIYSENY